MEKANKTSQSEDMLPENNLEGKKGVRGKYAESLKKGYSVRVLKADGTVNLREFIPKEELFCLNPMCVHISLTLRV